MQRPDPATPRACMQRRGLGTLRAYPVLQSCSVLQPSVCMLPRVIPSLARSRNPMHIALLQFCVQVQYVHRSPRPPAPDHIPLDRRRPSCRARLPFLKYNTCPYVFYTSYKRFKNNNGYDQLQTRSALHPYTLCPKLFMLNCSRHDVFTVPSTMTILLHISLQPSEKQPQQQFSYQIGSLPYVTTIVCPQKKDETPFFTSYYNHVNTCLSHQAP
jgi:hypothetical protein